MSRFKKSPRTPQEFIGGADQRTQEPPQTSPEPQAQIPWENLDPKATAKNVFNLRLNDYHMAMLHYLADQEEDTSMQKVVKRILLPELEKRARGVSKGEA